MSAAQSHLQRLADEDLIPLVQRGEPQAFEALFDRHSGAAFSLAYRMVGTRAAAEDVTQEAFLSVWRSGAHYKRERASVRTWLLGIVHHRAVDALRRNLVHERRRASADGIEERHEARERTDDEAVRRDQAREVISALATLPEEQGRVLKMAYYGGFTHTQIASTLELPVGTVKGRMRLGLDKMRDQLREEGVA